MNAQNGTDKMQLPTGVARKLENKLAEREITNYKIEVTSGAGKGDNYLGVIAKINIAGTDESGKKINLNWIAKIAPENESLKSVLNVDALYAREVYIYEEIFPLYARFQDERAALHPFDFHPIYVFQHLEENCFVMEDLKSIGFIMKDRKLRLPASRGELLRDGGPEIYRIYHER
ncbi:Ecdysteroid kinase-like family [Popillia japonica]|uniref:Ecdysteroid kinase-like family n=1 Tax=Popillia japonica TaxID=7064 RepID=A0AAW1IB04_POPJA